VDAYAVRVGETESDFLAAADAVARWRHAQLGWVAVSGQGGGENRRPAPGDAVCIAARALGPLAPWAPWLANPLVVVGVRGGGGAGGRRRRGWRRAPGVPAPTASDDDSVARYDVALATTAGHVLAGGERFSVVRKGKDGGVWFEAAAFARPASVAAAAGWPVVRALQAAFRRGAGDRVRQAVEEAGRAGGDGRRRQRAGMMIW
jgi:uncharacterized protein (UPF0548 family)